MRNSPLNLILNIATFRDLHLTQYLVLYSNAIMTVAKSMHLISYTLGTHSRENLARISVFFMILAITGCGGSTDSTTNPSVNAAQIFARSEVKLTNSYLVGGEGSTRPNFSLYTYDLDVGGLSSQCNQGCENTWLPLLVKDGLPSDAYTGLSKLSKITRHDATEQVTYDGKPLYFYVGDAQATDRNGQKFGGVWHLAQAYTTLYNKLTKLEPATQEITPSSLITRFSDRARDRHAREDQFHLYDHYLSFYWEHRTAAVEVVDTIPSGGNTITFNVTTQWKLHPLQAELRFFYRGMNTVAEYFNNGSMTAIDNTHYTRSVSFNSKTGSPLQVGDRLEFELSQFLDAVPNGRNNYYGTTYLYIVGQGLVPWEARGVFGDFATEREDSYPISKAGLLGGGTTLPYQYSNEPTDHFMQMPTNLSHINGQVFVKGRRIHHTDFGDGSHNETVKNPPFTALANKLGNHFINRACVSCHAKNGRAMPALVGQPLRQYVVRIGDKDGNADANAGAVLQPQINVGIPEGDVHLIGWTQKNGLRSPEYSFTGLSPDTYSVRIAPQLVGMGLLEAIKESDIEALADPYDLDGDGISGRMRWVTDANTGKPRLGRLGWKAAQPSVRQQVAAAFNTDMGVMTSLYPNPDCGSQQTNCDNTGAELPDQQLDELSAYVSLLGIRARRNLKEPLALQGEALFNSVGCASCHTITFQTSAFHPHTELRDQTIHPYSDLLLHDMGPGLASTLQENGASSAEWRTTPLWGIGLTASVSGGESYLHDGRARNLHEAIMWHGGESAKSTWDYSNLSQAGQEAIIAFLKSL